jgi:hypothetical protein
VSPPHGSKHKQPNANKEKQGEKESMHTLNSTLPNCSNKKATKLGAISKGNRKFHNVVQH